MKKNSIISLASIAVALYTVNVMAVNIAPLSNGGTLHYVANTNGSPSSSIQLPQTAMVDGDTTTDACRVYDQSQTGDPGVGIQRNFYQDVIITNITLYKSEYAENQYEKKITIACRTDNGWTNVFDGTSIHNTKLAVDLSSDPVTADAVRVTGWNVANKYLHFRELEIYTATTPAQPLLTNIASSATVTGTRNSADGNLTDGDPMSGELVAYSSGWVQLEWDSKQRIDEIDTNIEGYSLTFYGQVTKLEYLDTDDSTWVEYTDGYYFIGFHNGGADHTRDNLWDSGKNFDTPLNTKGIKFTTSGSPNKYQDMFEIYVYQKLFPPQGTLIIVK